MGLVVVVLAVAVLVGRLRGGRWGALSELPLRSRRLVVAALVAQVLGAVAGGAAYGVSLALSAGLVGAFLLRNRQLRGTGLVAAGLLANAVVVLANGAMPVSLAAAERAGLAPTALALLEDPRHEPVTAQTRLRLLGDVVAVPLPLRPEVVSPGDVLVAAGLAELVVLGMLGSAPRPVRP